MIVVSGILVIGGLGWFVSSITESGKADWLLVFPVLLVGMGASTIYLTLKAKWMITEGMISLQEIGKPRDLQFTEIEGFSINAQYIEFVPFDKGRNKLMISRYYKNYDALVEWAGEHFKNLDDIAVENERNEILSNGEFGTTTAERGQKLAEAKKVAGYFNGAGYLLLLWAFVYPKPYGLVIILIFLFPFVAYIPYRYYNGLLKINPQKNTAYADLSSMLVAPLGLTIRALLDFDICDYINLWYPVIVSSVIILALLAYKNREFDLATGMGKFVVAFCAVLCFGFSYGGAVFYNCWRDTTDSKAYQVKVIEKSSASGQYNSTYYLLNYHRGGRGKTQTMLRWMKAFITGQIRAAW